MEKLKKIITKSVEVPQSPSYHIGSCFIEIQLDKPSYFPGDVVDAVIILKSKEAITANSIWISIIGKEKAVYTDLVNRDNSKDFRRVFIQHRSNALDIDGQLEPGEYQISVQVTLPEKELP
jgi:hypothetical protein